MSTIELRVKIMKEMDTYIREKVGDDDITEVWLMNGVPDGADDDTLFEIAEIEDCWLDIVNCFNWCITTAGVITDEET